MRRVISFTQGYVLQITVLAIVLVGVSVASPGFRGTPAIFATVEGFALLGLVALGLSLTMVAGELDMSAGSMVAFSAVLAIQTAGLGLVLSVAIATLVGALFGAVQGYLIAALKINSLVFTVGSLIILQGAAWSASGNHPVVLQDLEVSDPLLVRYEIFSPSSIIALTLFVLVGLFMTITRWGREICAIGGGRVEATAAGVPVNRAIVTAFTISAGTAALAGSLAALRAGSASPDGYSDILLGAVAAALIGGISLYGGRGTVVNVVLGVVIVTLISAGLFIRGSEAYLTELITGAILVVVISVDYLAHRARRAAQFRRASTNLLEAGRLTPT